MAITTTTNTTPCRVPIEQCKNHGMCVYHHETPQQYTQETLYLAAVRLKWSSYYYLRGLSHADGKVCILQTPHTATHL